jgi:L-lysine 6-transaminase
MNKMGSTIPPQDVRSVLHRHLIADGLDMVLDMARSSGCYIRDELSERTFIDFFGFYASNALGMNHPGLTEDEAFRQRLMQAALNKVTNTDIYTTHMARFVDTFSRVAIPSYLPHAFFISGGALAVENALKAAFDWKVQKNFTKGYRTERGSKVIYLDQAFHGRSGYTLSLTHSSDPRKTQYYPQFDWPRITNPAANGKLTDQELEVVREEEELAVRQAKQYFHDHPDDIAAIIAEPIQGEGGDNHFRPEFLKSLRDLADENDSLLIFDEVQTGVGLTGSFWAHQGLGVKPAILAFGKKIQVCGILGGRRLDEVSNNVFNTSMRINSTWGGNLVDMVRFDRTLEIIESDDLVAHARQVGDYLQAQLYRLSETFDSVEKPRGRGLMCAFDMPSAEGRNRLKQRCFEAGLILLGSGPRTIRFRPPLTITRETVDEGMEILREEIQSM